MTDNVLQPKSQHIADVVSEWLGKPSTIMEANENDCVMVRAPILADYPGSPVRPPVVPRETLDRVCSALHRATSWQRPIARLHAYKGLPSSAVSEVGCPVRVTVHYDITHDAWKFWVEVGVVMETIA